MTVGSVEFTCPNGSQPFPACSEISPVCIAGDKVCNGIADCKKALDELPAICGEGELWYKQLNTIAIDTAELANK